MLQIRLLNQLDIRAANLCWPSCSSTPGPALH
jgi:hypothetical protein